MTAFEDPHKGRAEIYQDGRLFQVRIKSDANKLVTAFLGFWLCGWAFGEVTVLGLLLTGNAGSGTLFLLAWLGMWTVGGVLAMSQFLWGVFGYELLSLSGNALTIERHIPLYRRHWAYDMEHVTHFRAVSAAHDYGRASGSAKQLGLFGSRGDGTIQFDYGVRTMGFGLGLDNAEARLVVEKLNAHLGRG